MLYIYLGIFSGWIFYILVLGFLVIVLEIYNLYNLLDL